MQIITKMWKSIVDWFEHGDLVPVLIVVSAWHYMSILNGKDPAIVALAIGLLVDLGHYRTVRAAFRYSGVSWGERIARFLFAFAMTAVSLAYHQRYYNDWLLSVPIPLLIAGLAWLQRVDRVSRTNPNEPERKSIEPRVVVIEKPIAPIALPFVCHKCGNDYRTQQALAGHLKAHKNGVHP